MKFERIAIGVVGAFATALMIIASFNPPKGGAATLRAEFPRVALADAEPLMLPDARPDHLSGQDNVALGDESGATDDLEELAAEIDSDASLPEMAVASGAIGGSAHALSNAFGDMGYHFDKVITGELNVPRLFLAALPADIAQVRENKDRKQLFFSSVLPLVLQVNEEILVDRKRLWKMRFSVRVGEKLKAADRLWLEVMTDRYRVKRKSTIADIDRLIGHIDVVPPSLALAQAAEESGWGTSRFAKEGNALFGQWTTDRDAGLVPKNREAGKTHRVKSFPNLTASVRAYVRNINTHRAYREFRSTRAVMRRQGGQLDGRLLAGRLLSYSERGPAYVSALRGLIDSNKLKPLDEARLHTDNDSPTI